MAYDVVDFQKEVIAASYHKPILVDFWAPWCGPCRVLGPVLEKLAAEESDKWQLAKVNTDQNQEISMQYGIRGIPAVKLFIDGTVVNEFTGALPEHMLRKWLAEALPSKEALQLSSAEEALAAGQTDLAKEILDALIASGDDNPKVNVMMARLLSFNDLRQASTLLSGIELTEAEDLDLRSSVETLVRLLDIHEGNVDVEEGEGSDAYRKAARSVHAGNWDEALQCLIDVIQQNRYLDDDGARKAGIAIFKLLGPAHAYTKKHRRRFDMMLY